nr:uncharacterized protein LOC108079736 [Drosophila kikkawai]
MLQQLLLLLLQKLRAANPQRECECECSRFIGLAQSTCNLQRQSHAPMSRVCKQQQTQEVVGTTTTTADKTMQPASKVTCKPQNQTKPLATCPCPTSPCLPTSSSPPRP